MEERLNWKTEYGPADLTNIKRVESNFDILFPESYLRIVQKYQGGVPSLKVIVIENEEVIFGNLFTFLAFDGLDILDIINSEKRHLPPKHIPFADDETGHNFFCFDFSKEKPSIVYAKKEAKGTFSITFIAHNFVEFIQLLQ